VGDVSEKIRNPKHRPLAREIRNPKHEIRNKSKTRKKKNPKREAAPVVQRRLPFLSFGFRSFGFVSDFGFRASDFRR
jgi:hypothetical protein